MERVPLRDAVVRGELRVVSRLGGALVLERTASRLTFRQSQVLERSLDGRSLKEIGASIGLHPSTVCNHLRAALHALAATRSELTLLLAHEPAVLRDDRLEVRLRVQPAPAPILTRAEREVVEGVLRGLGNAAIAEGRQCTARTVANLLARVFRKLRVQSRAELVAWHATHRAWMGA